MPMTLLLPVPLTVEERLTVTDVLSATLTSLEAEKEKKKAANHELNAEIKVLDSKVHSLNQSLITGTAEKEVEIEEKTDLFRGVVVTIRLDTGLPVKERPMEPEERQLSLGQPLVPGTVTDIDAERKLRTDEQNTAGSPDEAEEMRDQRLAAEAAQREEIDRLAAEQTQDDAPKHLLKKPNGVPKRVSVRDKGEDEPAPQLCPRKCKERHKHTEERTSF